MNILAMGSVGCCPQWEPVVMVVYESMLYLPPSPGSAWSAGRTSLALTVTGKQNDPEL
eukprot:CAMPEP_0170592786 /NCGR_PEP_ID=MMETSP0224-20130122/13105_1 /TAXON_ID=285029 /ORGANISM="Togula jolla, Strain CCCM 725" /LENGTH=57 /DNA_ID=CAMNT_0010916705 /DNA_START=599 /DNA_END=772 /DNA_ORIENTATION=-